MNALDIRKSMVLVGSALVAAGCAGKGSRGAAGPDGPVGPVGVVANPPVIESIGPTIVSPAMVFTINGQNFSPTAANDLVTVGGAPAEVTAATANALTVKPPPFAITDDYLNVDVSIEVGGQVSNSATLTIVPSGTMLPVGFLDPDGSYQYVSLQFGAFKQGTDIYTFSFDGSGLFEPELVVRKTAADGTITKVPIENGADVSFDEFNFSGDPESFPEIPLAKLDATHVLVLDQANGFVWNVDLAAKRASIEIALAPFGSGFNTLASDGTTVWLRRGDSIFSYDLASATPTLIPLDLSGDANCSNSRPDILVPQGGLLWFLSGNSQSLCNVDPGTGTISNVPLTGDIPSTIVGLAADGATDLVIGAKYTSADELATVVAADGTTTLATPDLGLAAVHIGSLGGGTFLVSDSLSTFSVDATAMKAVAPFLGVAYPSALMNNHHVLCALPLPFPGADTSAPAVLLQVNDDTSSKILYTGKIGEIPNKISISGTTLYWSGVQDFQSFAGMLASVDLTNGTETALISDEPNPIVDFVRDANGNFYVVSGAAPGAIDKYDAQGGLVTAAWATFPADGSAPSLFLDGNTLYIGNGSEIDSVAFPTGGAATTVVASSVGLSDAVGMIKGKTGDMFVVDVDQGSLWKITADGFLKGVPLEFLDPNLSFTTNYLIEDPDGRLFFGNFLFGPSYIYP